MISFFFPGSNKHKSTSVKPVKYILVLMSFGFSSFDMFKLFSILIDDCRWVDQKSF